MSALTSYEHYQQRINSFLNEKLKNFTPNDPQLLEAIRYGLLIGGKRMRPYLAYITGEAISANLDDVDAIAGALECIHAYSLIHDDLPAMDNDDLRRGKPTCHKAFDEATAILAGDALQTLAFDILANHQFSFTEDKAGKPLQVTLIQQLVNASGYQGMCGGQALDLAATGKNININELATLHTLKTGALLEASVLMPAECSTTITIEQKQALSEYSKLVGLAYQVQDDIIDLTSTEEELGKPVGSDVAANKSTYPALLGLDGAKAKAENLLQQALQALGRLPYNTQSLADFATFIVKRSR